MICHVEHQIAAFSAGGLVELRLDKSSLIGLLLVFRKLIGLRKPFK